MQAFAPAPPKSSDVLRLIPASLRETFKDRPIMMGESAASYDAIMADILSDMNPSGPIEFLWCKEVADYVWDLLRLRRMRRQMIEDGYTVALLKLADYEFIREPGQSNDDVEAMVFYTVNGAREGSADDAKTLENILVSSGLTHELVFVEVQRLRASMLAVLDSEIVRYERRRDDLLHQMLGWTALRRARAREALDRAAKTIEATPVDVGGHSPGRSQAPAESARNATRTGNGATRPATAGQRKVAVQSRTAGNPGRVDMRDEVGDADRVNGRDNVDGAVAAAPPATRATGSRSNRSSGPSTRKGPAEKGAP